MSEFGLSSFFSLLRSLIGETKGGVDEQFLPPCDFVMLALVVNPYLIGGWLTEQLLNISRLRFLLRRNRIQSPVIDPSPFSPFTAVIPLFYPRLSHWKPVLPLPHYWSLTFIWRVVGLFLPLEGSRDIKYAYIHHHIFSLFELIFLYNRCVMTRKENTWLICQRRSPWPFLEKFLDVDPLPLKL